jgi:phosphatidylserine/phosphatidylglycerophosphate/cardiolipin synthase-like enzyme
MWLLIVSTYVPVMSMQHIFKSTKNAKPRNIRTCFNASNNIGRTHFVVNNGHSRGYSQSQPISSCVYQQVRFTKSLFAPQDDILAEISKTLSQAQKKIDIAAFCLTDVRVANQLIDAHKRGVDVCVIMDAGNMKNNYSKAQKLIDSGISVLRYDPSLRPNYKKGNYEKIMHLKWIIADDVLVTGSANLTRSAVSNVESIVVITCPQEIADHRQAFQDLKQYCVECKLAPSVASTK